MQRNSLDPTEFSSRAITTVSGAAAPRPAGYPIPSLVTDYSPLQPGGTSRSQVPAPAVHKPNQLLQLLLRRAPAEVERIAPLLQTVMLSRGSVLTEPDERIAFVYFPEGCATSLIKVLSNGKRIEVGTAGVEGMAGVPVFLGADRSPLLNVIQVSGNAQCMAADDLRRLATEGTALHWILQRYSQYQFDQAAQSIACNWMHRIEHRCARWLLMTHDRVQVDQFDLTHEYLATMLGARRAGVSQVAEALKAAGLISYTRGKITIVDRGGLEQASCECYASDRADYQRLLADA